MGNNVCRLCKFGETNALTIHMMIDSVDSILLNDDRLCKVDIAPIFCMVKIALTKHMIKLNIHMYTIRLFYKNHNTPFYLAFSYVNDERPQIDFRVSQKIKLYDFRY